MREVMTTKEWFFKMLLMAIPFVNIVFLIKWIIGGAKVNENLTNYARAYLIFLGLFSILYFASIILVAGLAF